MKRNEIHPEIEVSYRKVPHAGDALANSRDVKMSKLQRVANVFKVGNYIKTDFHPCSYSSGE